MTMDMNGNDGSGGFINIIQQENCRVAYTLNNAQPVRCSIIGDQPLFYMDFEGDFEEDIVEDLDPFGIGMIEQGVEALRQKLNMLDSLSAHSEKAQIRMADFIDETQTIFAAHHDVNAGDLRLKSIRRILSGSRMAENYMDHAAHYNIELAFSTQVELAHYDREAARIFLNPAQNDTDLVLLALRELRRVWQHKNGALLNPLTFHPDQAILVNRAQKADLAAAMLRGAWELQLSGYKDGWVRLEESSMEDLARAFSREAFLDFRTLNNGLAAGAVFETWFLSDRCRVEDRGLIQNMLSDHHGYVFNSEQSSKNITADLLMALGKMPFGKNYLAPFVQTILGDPLFSEVRDRSNANFLWFIKFERSFRDAEQELQTSSPIQTRADLHGSSITKNIKTDGDDEQTATVIPLPGMATGSVRNHNTASPKRAAGGNGGANIVYFNAGPSGNGPFGKR